MEKKGGAQSLKLTSVGPQATLTSRNFQAPRTGRLEVSVWLRTDDADRPPPMRIAIEALHDGGPYYRPAAVGRGKIGTEWTQLTTQFDDLPLDQLSDMHVRFDLMGAGDVWLDDVQLYPLHFTQDERVELFKIDMLARSKLQQRQVADCLRVLEGYWPQFLINQVTLTEQPVAQRPKPATPPPPPAPRPRAGWGANGTAGTRSVGSERRVSAVCRRTTLLLAHGMPSSAAVFGPNTFVLPPTPDVVTIFPRRIQAVSPAP